VFYQIEVTDNALIVRGQIPVDGLRTIEKLAKDSGFDMLDIGAAPALHATMVFVNKKSSVALRDSIAEKNRSLSAQQRWLQGTDTGVSSRAIFARMTSPAQDVSDLPIECHHPLDPDDFGRCYRLFQMFPEWRLRIKEMRRVSPQWASLVDHWNELEKLWESESSNGKRYSKLFARMAELLEHEEGV